VKRSVFLADLGIIALAAGTSGISIRRSRVVRRLVAGDAAPATPRHAKGRIIGHLDRVAVDRGVVEPAAPVTLSSGSRMTFDGWAIDTVSGSPAIRTIVVVDGKAVSQAIVGLDRADVAAAFHNPEFRFSGFSATLSGFELRPGRHHVALGIVTADGSTYETPFQTMTVTVPRSS
jgi:hypothetical protein